MNDDLLIQKRYRKNKLLKYAGIIAILVSCLFLLTLFISITIKSIPAFFDYEIKIDISDQTMSNEIEARKFLKSIVSPIENELEIFSISAYDKIIELASENKKLGWVLASSKLKMALNEDNYDNFNSNEQMIIKKLLSNNLIKKTYNLSFFFSKESREPELAGILTAFIGSLYTLVICFMIVLPLSICAAVYLEEFAPKNILTSIIEININNLAAVPSIVFGLVGLAVLINFFDLPRSSSIAAGITLSMMVLPSMIIITRQSLRTIPIAIKNAALALGATKMQIIMHHALPLALPGIMTGVILSMARAIGETAPLILIGMLAFIVDIPNNIFSPATALPVQIFLWADSPEAGFQAKTSAAILVLLFILILLNLVAIYIRKKFERKW
ncbi:MAG: phosphate ABC transporter permease PstA [Pseudomonadota bacterium]